ncbi:MAG: hypothetical protein ACREXW_20440 [Gammaproteobacteria bacterium]
MKDRAGAYGEVASDPDIAETQFAGDDADAFMGGRVLDEEQVFGQELAEAAVGFADAVGGDGAPLEPAFVDPFLDGDMGPRLQRKIASAGVLAVVLPERTLDIHGVRIVFLDQVAVIAVHHPHQGREGGEQAGREAAPESRGFLRKVEGEVGQAGAVRGAFGNRERLHQRN